jgi:hypothetical protein
MGGANDVHLSTAGSIVYLKNSRFAPAGTFSCPSFWRNSTPFHGPLTGNNPEELRNPSMSPVAMMRLTAATVWQIWVEPRLSGCDVAH